MRKVLVLLTMAGLFLSAFPTLSFAQEATPIVTDPQPTPTEVVNEPTAVPTEPTEEESTPAAEPNLSRSSSRVGSLADRTEGPDIFIDGKASNRSVPAGTWMTVSTEPGATLLYWMTGTCSDPANANHSNNQAVQLSANGESTYAFQAEWVDSPEAPLSDCLTVKWGDSGTFDPPVLTIGGSSTNQRILVGNFLPISWPTTAQLMEYAGAACEGTALREIPGIEGGVQKATAGTFSYQLQWRNYPDAAKSDCLSVEWYVRGADEAPRLFINGSPNSMIVPGGYRMDITTDSSATIIQFGNQDCNGSGLNTETSRWSSTHNAPSSISYMAAWRDNLDGPRSKCLTITWEVLENLEPPTIAVNDEILLNKTVDIDTPQTLNTDDAALIYFYEDAECSVGQSAGQPGPYEHNSETPAVVSFLAKWNGFPGAPVSSCVVITWEDEAPTTGPQIAINGQSENVELALGERATVSSEPGTRIRTYTDSTCSESEAAFEFNPEDAIFIYDTPALLSVKSYWIDYPEAPMSDCLTITWEEQSLPKPTLTLNGGTSDIVLDFGEEATWATDEFAFMRVFLNRDCSGNPYLQGGIVVVSAHDEPKVISVMAVHKDDASVTSDCLTATWSAPVPSLTLNGGTSDVVLNSGDEATFVTEDFTILHVFESLDCSGTPAEETRTQFQTAFTEPTSISVWAVHEGDASITSDCLTATWSAPVPSLSLNGQPSDATVDSGETVTFVTEDFALLQVFETLNCSGTPTSEVESGFAPALVGPTALSVLAVHKQDKSVTSECLSASWNAPAPPEQTPTPTPSPTPSQTPKPTETPVTKTTSITVEMWDGSSIEGAVWNLYAPVASQSIADAYASGTLGADNNAVLTDLPEGNYVFEVAPAGLDAQRFEITIGPDSQEIVLQFAQPAAPSTPTATTAPGEPTPAPTTAAVSGLPDTGTGSSSSSAMLMLAGLLAASVIIAAIGRSQSAE